MPGRLADSLGVPFGERILRLHRRSQGEDHLLGAFERVVEGLEPQCGPHARHKLHPLNGFGHEVVRSRFKRRDPVHHHHRQEPAERHRLDPAANLVAVHARHLHVEQDEVGRDGFDCFQGGGTILRQPDRAVDPGERPRARAAGEWSIPAEIWLPWMHHYKKNFAKAKDKKILLIWQIALLWAAAGGHEAVVKLLLGTGKAEVNSKDKDNQTPLLRAAAGGHEAVVKLLQSSVE